MPLAPQFAWCPSAQQRATLFRTLLSDAQLGERGVAQLVSLTEPRQLHGYGALRHRYTYSDLAQRVIPYAVERAVYAQRPLGLDHLFAACKAILPTPEMQGASAILKEDQVPYL